MAVFRLKQATKKFGRRHIISQASFELATGEILGLFGKNGSGKSTLLKMIMGTLKANYIEMLVDGHPVEQEEVIPGKLIGLVPQHPFLPPGLKVRDIIPLCFAEEAQQDKVFYDDTIADFSDRKVGELSHGQRKYFEVVLTAMLPHPFLMLDEPFTMLEPMQIEALKNFLRQLAETKGILITDHYYNHVLECATKSIVIADGSTRPVNSVADLRQFEYLSETN